MQQRPRIVEAMMELKKRRDDGEYVHRILARVAEKHHVPIEALRARAEASWGAPLESDRKRHAAHFRHVKEVSQVEADAREFARSEWRDYVDAVREYPWWQVDWARHIDVILAQINRPEVESAARSAFLDEIRRLERGLIRPKR